LVTGLRMVQENVPGLEVLRRESPWPCVAAAGMTGGPGAGAPYPGRFGKETPLHGLSSNLEMAATPR
jgi:hypothetical protein